MPKIRIPAWRRASPKKWNTRPLKMSPKAWPQKRMMSPSEATQSVGRRASPSERQRFAASKVAWSHAKLIVHQRITRISGCVASRVWVNT